jgi:hypothetical protein
VEGWLCEPWAYYANRRWLYEHFVGALQKHFQDPRAESEFYNVSTGLFNLHACDYRQSWDALADLNLLARMAGLRGLVILVDEFEDVIYNLRRIDHKQKSFGNLFRFFAGDFPGLSFFAVTPGFINKSKDTLMKNKDHWEYDYSTFDALSTFEMSQLETDELTDLASRIIETHGRAYCWEPALILENHRVSDIIKEEALQSLDRARHTIRRVVQALDDQLQGANVAS